MRRSLIVSLVVVVALAAAVFLAGWVQLALGADACGVLFSRTGGFEKAVILPQGFTWRWQRMIPGALTLYRFPVTAHKADLVVRGALPSGEVYGALAPEKPDFSFEVRLTALYRLKPEALPTLAEAGRLRPEGMPDLYHALDEQIKAATALIVTGARPARESGGLAEVISAGLPGHFPTLSFTVIAPVAARMPDHELYERMKAAYLQVNQSREDSLRSAAARLAVSEAEQLAADKRHERSLALLEKYGSLLDKHPQLIKFLFLAATKGFSPADIQSLDLLGRLEALR